MTTYTMCIAYERDENETDDARVVQDVADQLRLGEPHSTNMPVFGVDALDHIRTVTWSLTSLPPISSPPSGLTVVIWHLLRDALPLRGLLIVEGDIADRRFPIIAWQDHAWVQQWRSQRQRG